MGCLTLRVLKYIFSYNIYQATEARFSSVDVVKKVFKGTKKNRIGSFEVVYDNFTDLRDERVFSALTRDGRPPRFEAVMEVIIETRNYHMILVR